MATTSILLHNATILVPDPDNTHHTTALKNHSLLIIDSKIAAIGPYYTITSPPGSQLLDCTNKILSPGFIDTHHHLWQTQLSGLHVDHSLFDYMPTGALQSYNYSPEDSFWGELTGALDAIDGGTTYVLDHAHGFYTREHIEAGLQGLEASGLRAGFAVAPPFALEKWDAETAVPSRDVLPDDVVRTVEALARSVAAAGSKGLADGRVKVGFGFDAWYLPDEIVLGLFARLRKAGVELFTSHVVRGMILSADVRRIESLGVFSSLPHLVLSHCTGLSQDEKALLAKHGVHISSTPETEAPLAMGWPVLFDPELENVSVGVDCHTSNTAFLPQMARSGLMLTRMKDSLEKGAPHDGFPAKVRADTQKAFYALTMKGAEAVGLEKEIGSLEVGKRADVVVFGNGSAVSGVLRAAVENDPVTAVVRYSSVRDVEMVIVDGKIRKREGKLLPVEVPAERVGGWKGNKTELDVSVVVEKLGKSQKNVIERMNAVSIEKAREMLLNMMHIDRTKFKE